jgi:Yip1 domain
MDLGGYLQKGVQVLQLDLNTIDDVSRDEDALLPALLFFAVAGLANGAGQFSFRGMIFGPIVATLLSFVFVGLLSVLSRLFGGKGEFLDLYRPLGVAAPIFWVQAVPLLGPFLVSLALVYFAVVAVVVVERSGNLPRGKAVAVVALLAGILLFLVLVFLAMIGSMFLFRALFS